MGIHLHAISIQSLSSIGSACWNKTFAKPLTSTYICISLDATCTGSDGRLLDGPFMAQGVPSTAYQYVGEEVDPKMPSCRSCKEKNYSRTYCRVNKKHKALPWSTVYVVFDIEARWRYFAG